MKKSYNKIAIVNFRALRDRFVPSVRYMPTYELFLAQAMREQGLAKKVTIYTLYVHEDPKTYYDEWKEVDLILFWEFFSTKAPLYVNKYFELAPMYRQDLEKPIYFGGFWPTSYGADFEEFRVFDKIVQGFSIDATVKALAEENDAAILDARGPSNFDKYQLDPSHLRDYSKYMEGNILHGYITSFGCPGKCLFCTNDIMRNNGAFFSPRSLDQVKEDLTILDAHFKFKNIVIKDLNFFYDKKRARGILQHLDQTGKQCSINLAVTIKDIDTELMKSIQPYDETRQFYFGLESFDPEVRSLLGKPYTQKELIDAIELADQYGYDMTGNIMLGFSFQTKEYICNEVRTALAYMEKYKRLFIPMNVYKPEYGSTMQKEYFPDVHKKMNMSNIINLYKNDVGDFQETLYGDSMHGLCIEKIHHAMRLYIVAKRVRNYAILPIALIMRILLAYLSRQLKNDCNFDIFTNSILTRRRIELIRSKILYPCMRFSNLVRKLSVKMGLN